MDPGELDKRVSLMRMVETGRDGAGAPIVAPIEFASVWAKVVYPGGREFLASDGQTTERKVVFRIWARRDIDTETVVALGCDHHDVQDIRPFDDVTELHTVTRAPAPW